MRRELLNPRAWVGIWPLVALVAIQVGFEILGNLAHCVADLADVGANRLGSWIGLPAHYWGD